MYNPGQKITVYRTSYIANFMIGVEYLIDRIEDEHYICWKLNQNGPTPMERVPVYYTNINRAY